MTERVRYGRDNSGMPKNTLVTRRAEDADTIYFGISRCRLPCDRPNKDTGKTLAGRRADIAESNVAGSWIIDGSLYVHSSGLFGRVNVDEIGKLLSYFDSVDELCKTRAIERNNGK